LNLSATASILKKVKPFNQERSALHPKHIVVIDDDNLILTLAADFLSDAGFQVSTSDSPLFSNHIIYGTSPPDLILIDFMMPLMNGGHKIKTLKSKSASRDIPVILMSSVAPAELQLLAAEAGADGFLCKPFSATQLVQAVRKFL
jgi:DNA-binding response OmpR family regulator